MFQLLSRVFGGAGKAADRKGSSGVSASFQVSDAFHRQFLTECRAYLERLAVHQDEIFSRRVRQALGDVCTATQTVLARLTEKPETISEVRELPSTLRRIDEMLKAYLEVSSPGDPLERNRNREMCVLLGGITDGLRQTEQEMLAGAKIDLSALSQVLARSLARANGTEKNQPGIGG